MVKKYVRLLEERDINIKTGNIWAIQNVPNTWRSKVETQIISDGYTILDDGTVEKGVPNPNETEEESNGTEE